MIRHVLLVSFCFAALSAHRPTTVGQRSNDFPSSSSFHIANAAAVNGHVSEAAAAAATNGSNQMTVFRLPGHVTPVSYALRVATCFKNFDYRGTVEIVVHATAGSCNVTMNAKDVRVTAVRVTDQKSGDPLTVAGYELVDQNEQLIVTLNRTDRCLTATRYYVVAVDFEAPLRNDMIGYYKSSYKENGVTKWLSVTKFEPTHARKAFPCFDEPALKAPFKVSIRRRSNQISLSNMPLLNSTKIPNENMYWDHYQETPPISTYLVAFFVGEFYAMKTLSVGIYTHRSYVNQADYIASETQNLLDAMENFTGVPYTLPKIDLLAIPDFAAGAMENWGLNTYRERLLLVSENSRTKTMEFVTTVVQHELSHQWFGDLVTCAWWDYLWLNEGFATFFEYLASKMVKPDWRLEEVFVYQEHQNALESDQYPNHAISGSVKTPSEIRGMFDDISYSKAGAVLRMFMYAVTEENFKLALHYYLKNNQYKPATPEELWAAFETVVYDVDFNFGENISVTEFMKSWTEQPGYPLVQVTKVNNTLVVKQDRFLIHPSNETYPEKWIVGLTYTTQSAKDFQRVSPKIWLTGNRTVLPNQNETGWYIFNLQSTGFYRVNYDVDNWNALIDQLHNDSNVIHVLNRAQLIDDVFNLALAGRLDYILAMRLTAYLKNENDTIPWYSAKNGFTYLLERTRRCTGGYKNLKLYVGYLAGLIYSKTNDLVVNKNSSDHSVLTGWNSFSIWACKLDNEYCTKSALSYFKQWLQGKKIPADIKDAAFCVGVKEGGEDEWNTILNVYKNSESASDRQSAQSALGCSRDPIQLSKYLDFMFNGYEGPILPQDFRVIYSTLAHTPQGISALIEFLSTKLDRIVKEVINGEQVAASIYSLLASKVALNEEITKIDDLRKNSSVPVRLQKSFNSSFHKVNDNLVWFKTNHPKLEEWTKSTVHALGLDVQQNSSTSSTVNPTQETSTIRTLETSTLGSQPSSASINAHSIMFILLVTLWSSLVLCL